MWLIGFWFDSFMFCWLWWGQRPSTELSPRKTARGSVRIQNGAAFKYFLSFTFHTWKIHRGSWNIHYFPTGLHNKTQKDLGNVTLQSWRSHETPCQIQGFKPNLCLALNNGQKTYISFVCPILGTLKMLLNFYFSDSFVMDYYSNRAQETSPPCTCAPTLIQTRASNVAAAASFVPLTLHCGNRHVHPLMGSPPPWGKI